MPDKEIKFREDMAEIIFRSKWFWSNNKEHARIEADEILSIKIDGTTLKELIKDLGERKRRNRDRY